MNKGFTLLELLVVVMILGILTAMAMPQYSRSVRRAEMTEGLAHGRSIFDSALRYKAVNGEAPDSFSQLDIGFIGTNISGNAFDDGNFTYTLNTSDVTAHSNKGGYDLRFIFPIITGTEVSAPIACCPGTSKDGQWLCNNVAVASTAAGMPAGCREIK